LDPEKHKNMNAKKQLIGKTALSVAALCVVAALIAGCESSTTSELTISPSSVLLDAAKISVVTFTASGGDSNYTWSLESSTLGTIYAAGEVALYQNTTNSGTNYLTVVDSVGDSAIATIAQN